MIALATLGKEIKEIFCRKTNNNQNRTFTAKAIQDVFSIQDMSERVYNSSSKPNQTRHQQQQQKQHHKSGPADHSAPVTSQLLLKGQLPSPCGTLVCLFVQLKCLPGKIKANIRQY